MYNAYSAQVTYYDINHTFCREHYRFTTNDDAKIDDCVRYMFRKEHGNKYKIESISVNRIEIHHFHFKKKALVS